MKSLNLLAALATAALLVGCNQNNPPADADAPDVNVNVPPEAPDLNITPPPADAPDVNVFPPAEGPDVEINPPPEAPAQ